MEVAFIAFPPDVIARTSGIRGLGNYCVGKDVKCGYGEQGYASSRKVSPLMPI